MDNAENSSPEGVQSDAMGVQEAASLLGAHVETVRRLARKGLVPAYKLEKDWRFSRKALTAWVENQQHGQSSPLILVVDDEKSVRTSTGLILKKNGFRVALAESGEQGIECLQREMPDVALLDLMMPGLSGVDVLKALRAKDPGLPVILITGYPDSDLLAQALRDPPITLLPKPVDSKILLNTVKGMVRGTIRGDHGRQLPAEAKRSANVDRGGKKGAEPK